MKEWFYLLSEPKTALIIPSPFYTQSAYLLSVQVAARRFN